MHRFFIFKDCFEQDKVIISGEPLHQIGYVLRLKPGDRIFVLDNSGWEFEVEIERITKEQAQGKVVNKQLGQGEPAIKITLCQALLKADKFELVLQKSVELGVTAIVPFISERCVVKKPSESKIDTLAKNHSGSRRAIGTLDSTHSLPCCFLYRSLPDIKTALTLNLGGRKEKRFKTGLAESTFQN